MQATSWTDRLNFTYLFMISDQPLILNSK